MDLQRLQRAHADGSLKKSCVQRRLTLSELYFLSYSFPVLSHQNIRATRDSRVKIDLKKINKQTKQCP